MFLWTVTGHSKNYHHKQKNLMERCCIMLAYPLIRLFTRLWWCHTMLHLTQLEQLLITAWCARTSNFFCRLTAARQRVLSKILDNQRERVYQITNSSHLWEAATKWEKMTWLVIDSMVDVIFIADVVINFMTSIVSSSGEVIMDAKVNFKNSPVNLNYA